MPEGERDRLERYPEFAPVGVPGRPHAPDHLVEGGETIEVAGISFECVAVPGHSPAHVAYYADGELFSGDLLFAGSVGRVDLPGADWDTLLASVRMLADRLPPETVVYPGHGPETTLGIELERNPFLAELRARERESRRRAGRTTSCRPTSRSGGTSIRTIEEQCALYGWSRIQTPGFEDTALFERTSGAAPTSCRRRCTRSRTAASRSLTLRPEGTAPIAARTSSTACSGSRSR